MGEIRTAMEVNEVGGRWWMMDGVENSGGWKTVGSRKVEYSRMS